MIPWNERGLLPDESLDKLYRATPIEPIPVPILVVRSLSTCMALAR
jgi:hypothetical protein